MPNREISIRDFNALIPRVRDVCSDAISRDTREKVNPGIDGVAVLNLAFEDDFLKEGFTYQTFVLGTSRLWAPLFLSVLAKATLGETGVVLAHADTILRPEGEKFDIPKWRQAIRSGRRSPAFKVFLG